MSNFMKQVEPKNISILAEKTYLYNGTVPNPSYCCAYSGSWHMWDKDDAYARYC